MTDPYNDSDSEFAAQAGEYVPFRPWPDIDLADIIRYARQKPVMEFSELIDDVTDGKLERSLYPHSLYNADRRAVIALISENAVFVNLLIESRRRTVTGHD